MKVNGTSGKFITNLLNKNLGTDMNASLVMATHASLSDDKPSDVILSLDGTEPQLIFAIISALQEQPELFNLFTKALAIYLMDNGKAGGSNE